MSSDAIGLSLPESTSPVRDSCAVTRLSSLRGVRWRADLGILPSLQSASIEDLRRVAADSRRRYAALRRRLLVVPYQSKDGSSSPNLAIDNPLSQNPDSTWGQFFRNAELEKMLDQDLSRLYPEHGRYFQTTACQAMLRRILLLWCLKHPEYGYRQGMHELLAPLLYVLEVDVQYLSEVRGLYEDYFKDDFDEMSFSTGDQAPNPRYTKAVDWGSETDGEDGGLGSTAKVCSLDELDPDTREIVLLSDAYGAEGELGIVVSERFMEHDAYCMFEGLMNGNGGVVAMADFFSPSPPISSTTGLPPVIEASSALYHLLSFVDSSLHSHLIELGVEPQYFALRWLRVLFGREFTLENLLVVWDEIFSSSNDMCVNNSAEYSFIVLSSARGAFIAAMAVSMLVHVRSLLLATEHAASCLQRLLNFPQSVNLMKMIEKAKSLQALALEANISRSSSQGISNRIRPPYRKGDSLSSETVSPKAPRYPIPDSYWEEKWRVLHNGEELHEGSPNDLVVKGKSKGSLRERLGLSRTESDPSPAKSLNAKDARSSVRRSLVDDFSRETEAKADLNKLESNGIPDISAIEEPIILEEKSDDQNIIERSSDCIEDACLNEQNSPAFSAPSSSHGMANDLENDSEESSVTSNSYTADGNEDINLAEESSSNNGDNLQRPCQDSEATADSATKAGHGSSGEEKQADVVKERKPLSGKFQWLWKFGKGSDRSSEKEGNEAQKSPSVGSMCKDTSGGLSTHGVGNSSGVDGSTEVVDTKGMGTFKNLGQSMLENIQVIESVFQQDRSQPGSSENSSNNNLGAKSQAAAMAALKELRKISNLLSET